MLFNSFEFWIFFACVVALYWRLERRGQNILLLLASYFFYGYWDWRFLSLIAISTLVDFFVAHRLEETEAPRARKHLLVISILTNLGLLGFFKYFGFFVKELTQLLDLLGIPASGPALNIILPVGISFYTFQTLSYTIDVYRREAKPIRSLLDFGVFVAFFPQLVAGPIERSKNLLPQICSSRKFHKKYFHEGLYHILFGLFKKVVIADNMAPIVERVFSTPPDQISSPELWLGLYAFAIQIYCDFSGYSSIAQGLAKWMGINLSWNFKLPYFASNPSTFWTRWHITLSQWLRDYLYIPLGGNRGGIARTFRNLGITMALGGLWHGANWTFIVWGVLHGAILIAYRIAELVPQSKKRLSTRTGHVLRTLFFFHVICITWLFFRADSINEAFGLLPVLFSGFALTDFAMYSAGMLVFYAGPLFLLELLFERKMDMLYVLKLPWLPQTFLFSYFIMMLIIFPPLSSQIFIYFQF